MTDQTQSFKKKSAKVPAQKKERMVRKKKTSTAWTYLRPFAVFFLSLIIVFGALFFTVNTLIHKYFYPVDPNDATPIVITIPSGYGASAIAKLLYEACGEGEEGLIRNKAVFKIYVDFMGKSSKLQAGTYVFAKNMDIEQMVDAICVGNPPKETMRFRITEGNSVENIADRLVKLGVFDEAQRTEFLMLCRTGEGFENYSFLSAVPKNEQQNRDYLLEGYIFPDTYEIYMDATPESLINKALLRFNDIFSVAMIEQANTLGMSVDDVVILASMIEKEAKASDFTKVSAVFHNRLKQNMTLGSDATVQYITKGSSLTFTQEELQSTSLYNTYLYKGLPLGPIANPGLTAIEAALNPDEAYVKDGYLYFCLKDGESGELVFAKTLAEHEANVKKYRENW